MELSAIPGQARVGCGLVWENIIQFITINIKCFLRAIAIAPHWISLYESPLHSPVGDKAGVS